VYAGAMHVTGTALLLLLATFAFSLSGAEQKPAKDPKKKTDVAEDGSTVRGEVGKDLDEYMQMEANFPGGFAGAVLVSKEGEVLLEKGYGLANVDTKEPIRADALFDWCSVTKQFTAAAVLRLEMKKKLSIEDPLSKFFPKAPADKAKVTLKQLLNHTSGLKHDGGLDGVDLRDREAAIAGFLALPMLSKPGEKWQYNNVAYFLLAAIVEKVSGQPFDTFMNENVFGPAGMEAHLIGDAKLDLKRVPRDNRGAGKQFAYGPVLTWGYRGAGGAVASVRDMMRWHEALKGEKVLSKAAKTEYYTVGLQNYALGWEVSKDSGDLEYRHSGHTGEIITYYLRVPEKDIVVAIAFVYDPKTNLLDRARDLAKMAAKAKVQAKK
jgi:CubicO group peptidase (beta-lactamase class C family)